MNRSLGLLLFVAGCCLLSTDRVRAQAAGASFDVSKQYSAEMVITPTGNNGMTQKVYSDNGKVRAEMNTSGMEMISIVRPDLKKVYTVMVSQKAIMEMDYDPSNHPISTAPSTDGTFEVVGPDKAEGIDCTKYKMTDKDGKVAFFWVDTDKKALVKMMPADGTMTVVWKNFTPGPQDASLFEPPTGYSMMKMPSAPTVPAVSGQ